MSVTTTNSTVSYSNGYAFYTFTSTGSITFPSSTTARVLVVGGGGGGGGTLGQSEGGGGGGSGGVGVGTLTFSANTYTITVGGGGVGGVGGSGTVNPLSTNGANSSIIGTGINEIANGGGNGANSRNIVSGQVGGSGGSGGGGNGYNSSTNNGAPGNATDSDAGFGKITYYGNSGGIAVFPNSGGGGGGASSAGLNGKYETGGNGGSGYTWINGSVYGGGGGGGLTGYTTSTGYTATGSSLKNGTYGSGLNGGGNGGTSSIVAVAGTANTGGGGGGAYGGTSASLGGNGGAGGSGVVIIAVAVLQTGATVSYGNGYTFYTFTSTGSITFPSSTTARVLIVGGGGGGGGTLSQSEGAGGGGSGGVGVGLLTFSASNYTITVGNGGVGGVGGSGTVSLFSSNGTNSSISGTEINETSYGGGYGANHTYVSPQVGGSGGSGGGGNGYYGVTIPGTSTDGSGTLTYYGNSGGSGPLRQSGGGGGGASSVGSNGTLSSGGNGGSGYTWINGSVYGGGGGGGLAGSNYVSSGGSYGSGLNGGGNGGSSSVVAVAGTANTGGGGGGAYGGTGSGGNGGAGGSGVIIIAVSTNIQNGEFNSYAVPDNNAVAEYISSSQSTNQYVPGWTFTGDGAYIGLVSGPLPYYSNLASGQQGLFIQHSHSKKVLSQTVYLNPGNYTINFYASYRPIHYTTDHTLSVGISNSSNILANTQVPLPPLGSSATSIWQPYTYNFSINTGGIYSVNFTYNNPTGVDSTIFLTGVNIASTAPICYYTFDSSNADFKIQNIQTSVYDLSYVAVGTPNKIQISNSQPGTNFKNTLYQPTISSTNYSYYVNNSAAISSLNSSFSISVWYYYNSSLTATTPNFGMIWCLSDATFSRYITFTSKNGSGTGGQLILTIGLAGQNFYIGSNNLSSGWNHGVLTCSYSSVTNNTLINFYVNGVLFGFNGNSSGNVSNVSALNSGYITITGGNLFYGNLGLSLYVLGGPANGNLTWTQAGINQPSIAGSFGYPGYIGPLHAYNYALTTTQIQNLYNCYYVSPILYYSFEPAVNKNIQNLITYNYDLSYSQYSSGTTTSRSNITSVLGTQSLSQYTSRTLTACSYYIIPSTSLNFNSGNFSVAFWFNITKVNNNDTYGYYTLFSIRNGSEIFTFSAANNNTVFNFGILIANSSYNSAYYYSPNITITGGSWHHVVVTSTYDLTNTIIKIYIDSSLNTHGGITSNIVAYSSATYSFVRSTYANVSSYASSAFTIPGNFFLSPSTLSLYLLGSPDTNYNWFYGYIDELFIFNNTLTSTQISNLYNFNYDYITNYNNSTSYTLSTTLCYYDFASINLSKNILNVQSGVYDLSYNSNTSTSISRNTSVSKFRTPSLYQTGGASSSYYTNNTSIQNLNSSFTVAFWIQPYSSTSSGLVFKILGQQSGNLTLSFNNTTITIQIQIPGDSAFSLILKLTGLSNAFWNSSDWNHFTLSFSYNSTYTFANVYFNGILVNNQYSSVPSATTYITPAINQTSPITITGKVFPASPTTLYVLGDSSGYGYTGYLSNLYIFNSVLSSEQILNLTGGSITPIPFPKPWGAYVACNSNATLFDTTGNGNHATTSGTFNYINDQANYGAKATIPVLEGTATTSIINWPKESISSTFTICSITANLGDGTGTNYNRRVLTATNSSFLHGHYNGRTGVAFYSGIIYDSQQSWITPSETPATIGTTNWLVMCATNSATVPFPYNALANGIPVGNAQGGSVFKAALSINNGATDETSSHYAFNQVIIWDVALTASQLATMSSIMMNYLNTGIMYYPWLTTNTPINYNYLNSKSFPSQIIPTIKNGSFNSSVTAGQLPSVSYTNVSGWTVDTSGVNVNLYFGNGSVTNSTAELSPVIPTGQYFLLIQQNPNASPLNLYQDLIFATPGVYKLSFYASYRSTNYNINQKLKVSISNLIIASVKLVANIWTTYTYNFTITTPGTYRIIFKFTSTTVESSIVLTNIVVSNPPPVTTAPTIQNGSFNAVPFSNTSQWVDITSESLPGWTFTSSGSPFPRVGYGNNEYIKTSIPIPTPVLPPNQYFVIIQHNNISASTYTISQNIVFNSNQIGTFQLYFYAAIRTPTSGTPKTQTMNVNLTSVLSITSVPLKSVWNTFVYNFTITSTGTYTLTFTFTQTVNNDNSVLLTNIVINPLSTIPLDMNELAMYYPFDNDMLNYANIIPVDDASYSNGVISTNYTKLNMGSLYLDNTTNQYFQMQPYTLKNTGFTAAIWCRFNTLPTSTSYWQRIFDFGTGLGTMYSLSLGYSYDAGVKLTVVSYVNNSNNGSDHYANYILNDKNWHHYCLTISPTLFLTVYVDGLYCLGKQFKKAYLPIEYSLTNTYIGKSNFWSNTSSVADVFLDGYFNSFIVYNRCLGFSEISSLLSIKNTVLNGNFNNFKNIVDTSDGAKSNITSLRNNTYTYAMGGIGITGRLLGWSFTGRCHNFVINAGSGYITSNSSQQYYAGIQYELIQGFTVKIIYPLIMTQVIRFTPGTYTLYYTVTGRPGVYNSANTITSSISGLLSSYTPTLSTSWTQISQYFTVTYEQSQTLTFIFSNPTYTGDTSILLTNIYISPNTNYFKGTTDLISSTTNVLPLSGLGGFTPTITNDLVGGSFLQNNNRVLSTAPYYMHGTRDSTGFKVSGIDIGQYFQQTLPYDSYGYCFETNYFTIHNLGVFNAFTWIVGDAKGIWPENTLSNQYITTASVSYWLYYTFYYGGTANTGTIGCWVDNIAYIHFNNSAIGTVADQTGSPSTYSISIVNGLNYVRVACYNGGAAVNPAIFIAVLKDASSNVVAVTNSNWTWSLTPSTYATTSLYRDFSGALTFYTTPTDPLFSLPTYYANVYSVSTSGNYTVFAVESDGYINFPNRNANMKLYILAVAGGGGGGGSNSAFSYVGGGGAGEFLLFTHTASTSINLTLSIGAGGNRGSNSTGSTGGNTQITSSTGLNITCNGGGGGGRQTESAAATPPTTGGSSGGVGLGDIVTATLNNQNGISVTSGSVSNINDYGNNGGGGSFNNYATYYYISCGGGGAGGAGYTNETTSYYYASQNYSINGGDGGSGANPTTVTNYTNVGLPNVYFAAGGGGNAYNITAGDHYYSVQAGSGGSGGGGGGGVWNDATGNPGPGGGYGYKGGSGSNGYNSAAPYNGTGGNGLANSGSGGGGGILAGGNGGSGIVIITVLTSQLV